MVSAPPKSRNPKGPPKPHQAEMDLLPEYIKRFIEKYTTAIYPERLLQPAWAGQLALEEVEYIAWHLARDAKLRRLWGFKRRKRYPLQAIAERALPEAPAEGRRVIENALAARSAQGRRGKALV